jgi:hypothetical protein
MLNWKGFDDLFLRYYPSIHLEVLRKTKKTSVRVAGHRGQDLNQVPPEYRAGVLTTQP